MRTAKEQGERTSVVLEICGCNCKIEKREGV